MSKQFQKELKELLTKWDATIDFEYDDCSDMHGVTGEKIVVYSYKNNGYATLAETSRGCTSMDTSDL